MLLAAHKYLNTHFMQILVRYEREPELRRASDNTRRSALEKGLEALLTIYIPL